MGTISGSRQVLVPKATITGASLLSWCRGIAAIAIAKLECSGSSYNKIIKCNHTTIHYH
jgi:hypothetical protein